MPCATITQTEIVCSRVTRHCPRKPGSDGKRVPGLGGPRIRKRRANTTVNRETWRALQRVQRMKPEVRMLKNLRKRLRDFVRQKKGCSSLLFGCSPAALRAHIESKFIADMSWQNYGRWHIDHIRPCSSFQLGVLEHRIACFHWTNLRPLWAAENMAKSDQW